MEVEGVAQWHRLPWERPAAKPTKYARLPRTHSSRAGTKRPFNLGHPTRPWLARSYLVAANRPSNHRCILFPAARERFADPMHQQ